MTAPLVFTNDYMFQWPGHVFPTGKYRRLAQRLREAGLASGFYAPSPATDEQLTACHDEAYLARLERMASGVEKWDPSFEVPVSRQVVDVFRLAAGGTILASKLALEHGLAANLCGGFHHAFPARGEGFCLLNDVPVAAHAMRDHDRIDRAAVVDLDVHQGNGTAVMAQRDPWLYTFSMHQENNYPAKRRSDFDVGLPDGTGDEEYLDRLTDALTVVGRDADPDLVYYLAGADPYAGDRLGGLALSMDGLHERDRIVFDWAEMRGAAVVALLAGGYALDDEDVVTIHFAMVEELLGRLEVA
ncbi:MAG: histone deacetylase [Planctomycetota bacterium]